MSGIGIALGQRWVCRDRKVRRVVRSDLPNLGWSSFVLDDGAKVCHWGRSELRSKDLLHLENESRAEFLRRLNNM